MIKIVKLDYLPPKVTVATFRVEDAMVSLTGYTSGFLGPELEASTSGSNNSNADGGYFGNSSFSNISWD